MMITRSSRRRAASAWRSARRRRGLERAVALSPRSHRPGFRIRRRDWLRDCGATTQPERFQSSRSPTCAVSGSPRACSLNPSPMHHGSWWSTTWHRCRRAVRPVPDLGRDAAQFCRNGVEGLAAARASQQPLRRLQSPPAADGRRHLVRRALRADVATRRVPIVVVTASGGPDAVGRDCGRVRRSPAEDAVFAGAACDRDDPRVPRSPTPPAARRYPFPSSATP